MGCRCVVGVGVLSLVVGVQPVLGIQNGTIVGWEDYPFIASAHYASDHLLSPHRGTGVLVAPEWVLTAGHVVDGTVPQSYDKQVFAFDLVPYDIVEIIFHPEYDPLNNPGTDLALVRLATPVAGVQPATLLDVPKAGLYLPAEEVALAGYGATAAGLTDTGTLRLGTTGISIVSEEERWFATQPGPVAAWPGDSGGPAMIHDGRSYTVAGLNQSAFNDVLPWNIEVYLSPHRSFLDSTVSGITWGERHYRIAEGPAQRGQLTIHQGEDALRATVNANNFNLTPLTGGGSMVSPVVVWQVSGAGPAYAIDGLEGWTFQLADYEEATGTYHPMDPDVEYRIRLEEIDWTGYDPIHGVPRTLLNDQAVLMIYDDAFELAYSGWIDVSLTGNLFTTAGFVPADLTDVTSISLITLQGIQMTAPVPEPATASWLAGLWLLARRRWRAAHVA